jgi:molybdate transport system substrate-binding protein
MIKFAWCCLIALLPCLAFPGAAGAGPAKELTVAAALSLKNAFAEIGRLGAATYGIPCVFNFGASGTLAAQVIAGAPVDVFAAAAQRDMDDLDRRGLIAAGTRADFAANRMVLIAPAGAKLPLSSFAGLGAGGIRKIAIGNPKTVPAGRYAEEVFGYYRMLPALKDKFIYAENVRQVLDYVARGEVDAGVVFATDPAARSMEIRTIATAPEGSHTPAVCPIAVVKGTGNEAAAKAFITLVRSPEAREIFRKHGFRSDR